MTQNKRIILALTGASGAIFGLRALEILRAHPVEVHLVISAMGERVLKAETGKTAGEVSRLADYSYPPEDLAAPIASGSFRVDGMLIVPCSIKTLSAVANSYADSLIPRAADVCLKEGRPLLLAVREAPLHSGHLELMGRAARVGAIIFPPVPAFYSQPKTIDDLVNMTVGRMLARVGVENSAYLPWQGSRK
ncbi:MAG TPA: UbiX family flavin prenyltransferase [Brevefilum sp.]|nr:UbiX family flavin prenyltransferase [Candidatus Cloacimonadota bacterium]HOE70095.1 UbiX family flavin prenyltransferase [Brevefilum sp.]HOR19262.1 UbiX family flavin prenyltransferase [Brevefilum sp.]HPL69490.1 UbiX family flavin prenyltransferase [Brevefilum sp.]